MSSETSQIITRPPAPAAQVPQSIPPDLLEKIVNNHSKELEHRAQEIALQAQKDANAYEFGKAALAAQAKDREDERKHTQKCSSQRHWFYGFCALLLVALVGYALHLKNEAFAMEMLNAVIFLFGGGVGGYGLAKSNDAKRDPKKDT